MAKESMRLRVVHWLHAHIVQIARTMEPERHPRVWSNTQVAAAAKDLTGDVLHVSAWEDEDKRGRKYKDYFPNAQSYTTTNYGGARGTSSRGENCITLDLEAPLSSELHNAFDVVFNRTTLEHVYDVHLALDNLFRLSKRDVLLVVPFMQVEHWESPSYGDFWRFTEHSLVKSALERNFKVVSLSSNHNAVWPIYYFMHARRQEKTDSDDDLWRVVGTPAGFGYRPLDPRNPLMT